MSLPGFTAEASLYDSSTRYRGRKSQGHSDALARQVNPAWGKDWRWCGDVWHRCISFRCERFPIQGETPQECSDYCEEQWQLCAIDAPVTQDCLSNFGCGYWERCINGQCVPRVR